MLRKRIKKNTLKWKKIYAEQLLDIMDEEENALQKIYLTGYVLELKKNRYFAGWYKDRIVCRSLEYARYFPSAEAAEEYVHKYLGFAGMTCYICHVNWTLASCESENMEDNEENLLEENGKILSFANYADVKQYQKQRGMEKELSTSTATQISSFFPGCCFLNTAPDGTAMFRRSTRRPRKSLCSVRSF
jgi:hypothetical protein